MTERIRKLIFLRHPVNELSVSELLVGKPAQFNEACQQFHKFHGSFSQKVRETTLNFSNQTFLVLLQ